MDRVERFLGGRLRGRAVPADLRRLVEMQLDGELERDDRPLPFGELRLLEPGEVHPLEQPTEPLANDPRPEEVHANSRAIAGVLAHVAAVVYGFNGNLWGYWLHPDEPADVGPLAVKLDTEGCFSIDFGESLVEAMIFDWAGEDDISEIAEYCDRYGIPLVARSEAELRRVRPVVAPAVLHDKLYKQAHPNHERPVWSDEVGALPDAAPLSARADDPRVARALALCGLPGDPMPMIRAADVGEGEVVLRSTRCAAEFEFHRENDTVWYLHQMRFDAHGELPACNDVPFGVRMDETRQQCCARLGEPSWKSPLGRLDGWRFGRVKLQVSFGKDDLPRVVRCMPALGND